MEAICSSELSVDFEQTARRYIPEHTLQEFCMKNHIMCKLVEFSLSGAKNLFQQSRNDNLWLADLCFQHMSATSTPCCNLPHRSLCHHYDLLLGWCHPVSSHLGAVMCNLTFIVSILIIGYVGQKKVCYVDSFPKLVFHSQSGLNFSQQIVQICKIQILNTLSFWYIIVLRGTW
jgi:hypothetical protein